MRRYLLSLASLLWALVVIACIFAIVFGAVFAVWCRDWRWALLIVPGLALLPHAANKCFDYSWSAGGEP